MLLNVIPQLEEELKLDDLNIRMLATNVLGEMFADKASILAKAYPSVWQTWLERRHDKHVAVRLTWIEYCVAIYKTHPELSQDLNTATLQKLLDPDEKVRSAMIRGLAKLDLQSLLGHVSKEVLVAVGDRCRDKKPLVRQDAFAVLSKIYHLAYLEVADVDNVLARDKFAWIPTTILNVLYSDDAEGR